MASTNRKPAPSEKAKVASSRKLTRPLTARETVLLSQKVAVQIIGGRSPGEANTKSPSPGFGMLGVGLSLS